MKSVKRELETRVSKALVACFGDEVANVDPLVGNSRDPKFGDYQANFAMSLAKKLGKKPRDVASEVIDKLDVSDLCETPEIAGPGFVNFTLTAGACGTILQAVPPADDNDRLGIPTSQTVTKVAIDASSPNLAKEMHVGHLRSTIIGDCIGRLQRFEGHDVEMINHVGDWGTQFGMLIEHLRRTHPHVLDDPDNLEISDLEGFYVEAKAAFDANEDFKTAARKAVVALQGGDETTLAIWRAFCHESLRHCHRIYKRLDVELIDRGESYYNDMLPDVVENLQSNGMAVENDGAICVFLEGYTNRDGDPLPMMIRKSDGGYNYDTTDLAALRHRTQGLKAERLLYIVGIPQKQHFEMLFAAARKADWATDDVELRHLGFGSVLGSDGKPFKTREGGTVKLKDVLEEAVNRARKVVENNRPEFTPEEIQNIGETVGIGAVKYFDLSHSLSSDYKFDWDNMLSLDGNTAPYMLYAYARIRSIGREAGIDYADIPADTPIMLEHESEIRLGKALLRLPEIIHVATREYKPNVLTEYLYDLSKAFNVFYDRKHGVRVKDAEPESVRLSRLRLCDLTARALKLGLNLLGIGTVEKM